MEWIKNLFSIYRKQNELIIQQTKQIEDLKRKNQKIIIGTVTRYNETDEIELFNSGLSDNILKMLAYEIALNSDTIRGRLGEMSTDERIGWHNALYYLYVKVLHIKEGKKQETTEEDE